MKTSGRKPGELYILRLFIVFMIEKPKKKKTTKRLIAFLIYKSDSPKGYSSSILYVCSKCSSKIDYQRE